MNLDFIAKSVLTGLLSTVSVGYSSAFAESHLTDLKPFGHNYLKPDGSPRTVAILLFDGMTAQDFVGVYSILNISSGDDLKFKFVAKEKGQVHDERGRLAVYAQQSLREVKHADILIVPGGRFQEVVKDPETLAWVKMIYDNSEYTASICTGSVILAAAGAIPGKQAGTAWAARGALEARGVRYVATPPPAQDGKYISAAGAAAGIEIGLILAEKVTGSKALSEITEFGAEWNPHMLYNSGDPQTASPRVIANFVEWMKSDPVFKD